jgi:hypothetical protein
MLRILIRILLIIKTLGDVFPYKTPSDFKLRILDWHQLKPGDVIGVHRKFKNKLLRGKTMYDHYGIYAGDLNVIHLSNGRNDFLGGKVCVRQDPFYQFKDESSEVFVVDFDRFNEYLKNLSPKEKSQRLPHDVIRKILGRNYHPYSPEETLNRAKSKMGKEGYNLFFHNCEHFALWCKTGICESSQIARILEIKLPTSGD